MKAAADIIDEWQPDMGTEITDAQYHFLKIAINEARRDIIEECAKKVAIAYKRITDADGFSVYIPYIDKEPMLNLIKELK